jgi:hypothetical protein
LIRLSDAIICFGELGCRKGVVPTV